MQPVMPAAASVMIANVLISAFSSDAWRLVYGLSGSSVAASCFMPRANDVELGQHPVVAGWLRATAAAEGRAGGGSRGDFRTGTRGRPVFGRRWRERDRTCDIAQLTASSAHALPNGRTSFTLDGQLTQESATQGRLDGNGSLVYGSTEYWLTVRKSFQAAVRFIAPGWVPPDPG